MKENIRYRLIMFLVMGPRYAMDELGCSGVCFLYSSLLVTIKNNDPLAGIGFRFDQRLADF